MENNKYNGWSNYATWRIALEWMDSDEFLARELNIESGDVYSFGEAFKSLVMEYYDQWIDTAPNNPFMSYALSFLEDVNWKEIAEHYYKNID